MENKKTVYTVPEVQEMLGIGKNKAYELCTSGEFPHRRIGKTILVPIITFNNWLYDDTTKTI